MCPLWQGEEAWLLSHDGGPRTQLNTSLGDPGHHLHGDTHHPALPASEGNRPDQPLPTTDRCSLGEERGPVRSAGVWKPGERKQTDKGSQSRMLSTPPPPRPQGMGREGRDDV